MLFNYVSKTSLPRIFRAESCSSKIYEQSSGGNNLELFSASNIFRYDFRWDYGCKWHYCTKNSICSLIQMSPSIYMTQQFNSQNEKIDHFDDNSQNFSILQEHILTELAFRVKFYRRLGKWDLCVNSWLWHWKHVRSL